MQDHQLVELTALAKRFGEHDAVTDITLTVGSGEIFALLGPNGAGKTTSIRMMMGILKPTSGQARIDGLDCFRERDQVMRRIGYVPDEPIFYDYLKGEEIIRFVGEMHGLDRKEIHRRAGAWMERLSLTDAAQEYAVNYSKGMKKKLATICALLHRPKVLILDEPTNGLDPYATRTLHAIVKEVAAEGNTVFFSTHLLDQAERLCQRIGIIYEGRMAAVGTLAELRGELTTGGTLEEIFFAVTSSDSEDAPAAGGPPAP